MASIVENLKGTAMCITFIVRVCVLSCRAQDGSMLFICSSDGYVTIARFRDGVLGERLADGAVPAYTRVAFPRLYTQPTPSANENKPPVSVVTAHVADTFQPSSVPNVVSTGKR